MRLALLILLCAAPALAQTARHGGPITASGETYADPDDPEWTTPAARFDVEVGAGQTLLVTYESGDASLLYPRLILEAPSGARSEDDRQPDVANTVVARVDDAEPGTWTVIATCQGECEYGTYALAIDVLDEPPPPTVFEAAATGDLDALRALLADDASAVQWRDGAYRTPLMHAAQHGHVDAMRALLDAGAEVDAVAMSTGDFSWDQPQTTALHDAAGGGHADAVALLLEAGADPDALAMDGMTPLHHAVFGRSPEAVRRLLDAGADATAAADYGGTPAELAATSAADDGVAEADRARLGEILALLGAE